MTVEIIISRLSIFCKSKYKSESLMMIIMMLLLLDHHTSDNDHDIHVIHNTVCNNHFNDDHNDVIVDHHASDNDHDIHVIHDTVLNNHDLIYNDNRCNN